MVTTYVRPEYLKFDSFDHVKFNDRTNKYTAVFYVVGRNKNNEVFRQETRLKLDNPVAEKLLSIMTEMTEYKHVRIKMFEGQAIDVQFE